MENKEKKVERLHPILMRHVVAALQSIFVEENYADKVIEHTFKNNKKAGSKDRAFIAGTIYDVVRNYRLLANLLGGWPETEADWWKIVGIKLYLDGKTLPEWNEFEGLDFSLIADKKEAAKEHRAVYQSIPDWMDTLGAKELGEAVWTETLEHLNKQAEVVLRTNTLRGTRDELMAQLAKENIETIPLEGDIALKLAVRKNVFRTDAFKKGMFEVQDFSSQMVATLLAPEPGMRVIDACAGAGGKTLHLAALMQNKGRLIAMDNLAWKLKALQKRAKRAGVHNCEGKAIENKKTIKRLYSSADRLLLDVPCSGLGVLRRNPDSKWKLKPEFIENIKNTQMEILNEYNKMLKSGGKMVYATCSVLPSENSEQVAKFLASEAGEEFKLIKEQVVLPQDMGFDGFYMALMEKQ